MGSGTGRLINSDYHSASIEIKCTNDLKDKLNINDKFQIVRNGANFLITKNDTIINSNIIKLTIKNGEFICGLSYIIDDIDFYISYIIIDCHHKHEKKRVIYDDYDF